MSGVCKIARRDFKPLKRTNCFREDCQDFRSILEYAHTADPRDRTKREGPRTESQQNSVLFLVLGRVPATARCHPFPISATAPTKSSVHKGNTVFLKTLLRVQTGCVGHLFLCEKGKNVDKCAHTFVLASVFVRHCINLVIK